MKLSIRSRDFCTIQNGQKVANFYFAREKIQCSVKYLIKLFSSDNNQNVSQQNTKLNVTARDFRLPKRRNLKTENKNVLRRSLFVLKIEIRFPLQGQKQRGI